MSLGETRFETERLHLEPLCASHAGELFEILSDRRIYRFIPQEPPTLAALTRRYGLLESRMSPDGREHWLNWVLRSRFTSQCLGTVQVTLTEDARAQLAYELGVPFWGRGFATEACRRIFQALWEATVREVWAELDTRNQASIRLLERLGFQRGALRENADVFKGSTSHEWTYFLRRPGAGED